MSAVEAIDFSSILLFVLFVLVAMKLVHKYTQRAREEEEELKQNNSNKNIKSNHSNTQQRSAVVGADADGELEGVKKVQQQPRSIDEIPAPPPPTDAK